MWHIEVAFLLNHPILTQNGWAAQESTSRHCVSENWRFALRSTSYSDVFDWRAEPFSLNGILFLLCLCFQFYLSVKEKKILMRILSMGDKISKLMSGLFSVWIEPRSPRHTDWHRIRWKNAAIICLCHIVEMRHCF